MSKFEDIKPQDPFNLVFNAETTRLLNELSAQILILPPGEAFTELNSIICLQSFCEQHTQQRKDISQRLERLADFLQHEINERFCHIEASITGTYDGAAEDEQIAEKIAMRLSEILPTARQIQKTPPCRQIKNMTILHSALIEFSRNIGRVGRDR